MAVSGTSACCTAVQVNRRRTLWIIRINSQPNLARAECKPTDNPSTPLELAAAHYIMVRRRWSDDGFLVCSQVSIPSLLFRAVGLIERWRVRAGEAPFRTPGRTPGEARSR